MHGILFDHVACGVRRTGEIAALLEYELGARPHRGGPGAGFRGGQWQFDGDGRLELIEPDGPPDGFLHRFLAGHGPGIHHVTFKVPDIHDARDRATRLGYAIVGFRDDQPAWKECFLHPKQVGGIVVQIVEADPSYADDDDWRPFPRVFDGAARRSVRLIGPRLVLRDRERAHRCWVELLGASFETTSRAKSRLPEETFRWQDSPLELRVVFDPAAKVEGPVGLELAAFGAPLPESLPALLGTDLLQV